MPFILGIYICHDCKSVMSEARWRNSKWTCNSMKCRSENIEHISLSYENVVKFKEMIKEVKKQTIERLLTVERIEELSKRYVFQIYPAKLLLLAQFKCTSCESDIVDSEFKTYVSQKEYLVSGLCLKCQHKFFLPTKF